MQLYKKLLSVIICIVVTFTAVIAPSAQYAFANTVVTGTVITETDPLRVRSAPNTSSSTIGWAPKGSTVTITDSTSYSGWYQIDFNGSVGYVSSQYIRINAVIPEYTPDADFEAYLTAQNFPESYKEGLRNLHAAHPNWIFVAQDTGLKWSDAVAGESVLRRSLVQKLSYYPDAFYSYQQGAYNPDTGKHTVFDGSNWIQASEELIKHCLDPRNYLTDTYIYAFLNLSYSSTETVENINQILKDTFMEGAYPAQFDEFATYADAFLDAAKQTGVSTYHLASRCRQEQGASGTKLSRGEVSGYEGYYNFFNINAYNNGNISNVTMGAMHAKNKGWDTPYKSILGGAEFLASGYISVGQDTLYLQRFDLIEKGGYYTHLYMTNIQVVFSEANILKNGITDEVISSNLVFKIPVFRDMPSTPCVKPTGSGANNYLLNALSVEGHTLSPAFSTYTYDYELVVSSETDKVVINATPADSNAKVTGTGVIPLNYGDNKVTVTVTAQSGTKRNYTIDISRQQPSTTPEVTDPNINGTKYTLATYITGVAPETAVADFIANLGISNGSVEVKDASGVARSSGIVCSGDNVIIYKADGTVYLTYEVVIYGDINADGKITTVDLFMGQRIILGTYSLTGSRLCASDVNKDGKLTTVDLFMGQRHILGTYTITQ